MSEVILFVLTVLPYAGCAGYPCQGYSRNPCGVRFVGYIEFKHAFLRGHWLERGRITGVPRP